MTTGLPRLTGCCLLVLLVGQVTKGEQAQKASPARELSPSKRLDFFPVTTQFSQVPSGKGWKGQGGPIAGPVLRDTVDNILAHGFTGLEAPTQRPKAEEAAILDYAQSRGMVITSP